MKLYEDLEVGTKVVTVGGPYPGFHGTIARSYTIRFGHRMYDVDCKGFHINYLGAGQVEPTEEAGK